MLLLKETLILGLVLLCIGYVSPALDFSELDFVHDEVMKFYGGTERTVNVLKPKLVAPPPAKKTKTAVRRKRPGKGVSLKKTDSRFDLKSMSVGGHKGPTGFGGGASGGGGGGGFGHRFILRRRRPIGSIPRHYRRKAKLTFIQQTKTYKRRKAPSNKFLEAVNAIERGVADAKAAEKWKKKQNVQRGSTTKNVLSLAVKNRMFQYARLTLGRTLYYIKNTASRRPKRSTQNQASSFMNDLKQDMGSEKFDEFMAVMGDVTLMFAMDTTGSMSDEIETAKKIAVDVINYPRQNPVSYILSPFNDPKTGPVTYKNSSEGALFVDAISKLSAHGGGDCAEMAITGILSALYAGPDWGSPLYVFTDASAKDDAQTNLEEVKQIAKLQGSTINFFTTGSHCSNPNYKSFQEIADATSGQVLSLSDHQELQQLTGFTGSVLGGSNVISSGSNISYRKKRRAVRGLRRTRKKGRPMGRMPLGGGGRSKKRGYGLRRVPVRPRTTNKPIKKSQSDYRYSIKIDDSIEKISICITTTRLNQGSTITLTNPGGVKITTGKKSMSKISVYEVTSPPVGTWSLVIPSGCGTHSYFVKSTSDTNIDLEHYFMQSMPGPVTDVPVSDPLIGRQTKLIITIAGYHKVQKSTVVLELITKYGKHISDVTLTPDKRGMRYVAPLTPPSRPFKLKIKGMTKAGNSFERISRNVIEPKHISLRVLHSDKDFTLRRGQQTTVTFHIFNQGAGNTLTLAVKDRLGYAAAITNSARTVRKGRWAFFRVIFNVPLNAKIGASDTAVVSVTYNNGAGLVMKPVQLLVVA